MIERQNVRHKITKKNRQKNSWHISEIIRQKYYNSLFIVITLSIQTTGVIYISWLCQKKRLLKKYPRKN